jgi:hypothetical protein
MAAANTLQLIIQVDADKANASIKSVNTGLSSIETTAVGAAKGASHGIDGMTASMVKGATAGNLLAEVIKTALTWAKDWTVGAVQAAAQVSRMTVVTQQLARAHGQSAGEAMKYAEAIQRIGFENEEALHAIDRLIIADLELSKAEGLAKLAKDAAAIENVSAGQAIEGIIQAIESGASRGLRSMGIFVDFQKDVTLQELKLGRALTEAEEKQVRYNAVMREGAKIQGAHAAASGEAESMLKGLKREFHDLQEELGAHFQEEYKKFLGTLKDLAQWAKDNVGHLTTLAEAIKNIAIVIVAYEVAPKILSVVKALQAFRLAAIGAWVAANPFALITAGVAVFGLVLWNEKKKLDQLNESLGETIKKAQIIDAMRQGKTLAQMKEMGFTEGDIREALTGGKRKLLGKEDWIFGENLPKLKLDTGPTEEQLKLVREIRRKQMEAVRSSAEAALQAEEASVKGPAKALLEVQRDALKYSTFVDEKGALHKFTLLAETRANLERELSAKVRAMQKEEMAAYLKEQQGAIQQRLAWESDLYQKRLQYEEDVATKAVEHLEKVYGFEEQRAGFSRDAQLRALEAADAQTLRQKLAVEQRKMEIEVEYLEKVHEIKLRLFDMETFRMALEEQSRLRSLGYTAERINQRIAELTQQREDIRQQMSEQTDAAIAAARENAAIRQTQAIRDQNRQVFESFKRQAEGVFDALLTKSQSIWSAIGNSLKTALLTAIKDVITSRVAAMFMQLFMGTRVSLASGGVGGGGSLGRLGSLLGIGAVPVFGGGGVPGLGGFGIPGAPGGTVGFTGPVSMGGSPAGTASTWGANFAGMVPGLKSFFGVGGSVQLGPGMATTWQAATMGQKLAAIGKSDAALMGGALLAMEGLRRGGASGLAMTTGGGALIGFKFGGPVGAAIGASIGAVAGIVRLFVKGATEKAREKIKAIYGVDISDKAILRQIVDTAKQGFGGNLDVAIRSPQVRDLIELYAMATGQSTAGLSPTVRPVSLVQQGGSLYQQSGFSNGSLLPSFGGLPTIGLDRISAGTPQNAGPIVIQLDGPATTALLQGEAVQAIADNPRLVQGATMTATRANAGRREMLSLQLSPGTLTS